MINWFIKNKNLLIENSNIDDLLDLSAYVNEYYNKIEWYQDKVMIILKWRFWIWKSTFLYHLWKKLEETKQAKFVEFDAWKFPNREDLWEGFVLELARAIDEDTFSKFIRKIDWKTPTPWVEKFISFTSWIVWKISNFNDFLNTSPAKRTFEIQNILTELINTLEEESLYIVIEDIDRSWDKWIFFLETLNHFIKNTDTDKKIKIIVPISNSSYEKCKPSYHKCFDYIDRYRNPEYKLQKFCDAIFTDEVKNSSNYKILVDFLEGLFKYYNEYFTIRDLKLVLRQANENFKSLISSWNKDINYVFCIWVEAWELAYLSEKVNWKVTMYKLLDYWKENKAIPTYCQLFFQLFSTQAKWVWIWIYDWYSDELCSGLVSNILIKDWCNNWIINTRVLKKDEYEFYLSDIYLK